MKEKFSSTLWVGIMSNGTEVAPRVAVPFVAAGRAICNAQDITFNPVERTLDVEAIFVTEMAYGRPLKSCAPTWDGCARPPHLHPGESLGVRAGQLRIENAELA